MGWKEYPSGGLVCQTGKRDYLVLPPGHLGMSTIVHCATLREAEVKVGFRKDDRRG